jgi:hypothetical protein
MTTSGKTLAQLLDEFPELLNNVARQCVEERPEIVRWRFDRTARMTGDYVDAVQDQQLTGWDEADIEYTWVCCDAGPIGGEVLTRADGNRYVDLGDRYLDADSGEIYAPGER